MGLVRCPHCRLRSSDRARRCYHCGGEVQPHRGASRLLILVFALAVVVLAAGVIFAIPTAAWLVGRLQQVDDAMRVWRVGIGLAVMLLLTLAYRLATYSEPDRQVYVPTDLRELGDGESGGRRQ